MPPPPSEFNYGINLEMDASRFITGVSPVEIYQTMGTDPPLLMPTPNPPAPGQVPSNVQSGGIFVTIQGNYMALADPSDGEGILLAAANVWEYDESSNSWDYAYNTGGHPDVLGYGLAVALFEAPNSGLVQLLVSETEAGPGRIYIYDRDPVSETWALSTTQPYIYPHNGWDNGNVGSAFGRSMAVHNDLLVVGQPYGTNGANLYRWDGTQWLFEVELGRGGVGDDVGNITASDIDIDDNLVVVSAPFKASINGPGHGGAVYVYEHDGAQWTGPTRLESFDPFGGGRFGNSVAINAAHGRLAVGAPQWTHSPDNLGSIGAAFVFQRTSLGNWIPSERLGPVDAIAGRNFGQALEMNDDILVLGTRSLGYSIHPFSTTNPLPTPSAPSICHGDGGDLAGCVDCPCGNNAIPGTLGGCLNVAGQSAHLTAERSLSVQDDSLLMKLERVVPTAFCLLTSGTTVPGTAGCAPNVGSSAATLTDGLRCVGSGMRRHGIRRADENGELTEPWQNLISQFGFTAGEKRYFQAIYRDGPLATPYGTGLNSSNAIQIELLP